MPLFRVRGETSRRLIQQPESGMGYQVIAIREAGMVVFNATVAIFLEELRSRQFSDQEYNLLSGDPENPALRDLEPLEIREDFLVVFSIFNRPQGNSRFGLTFAESAVAPSETVIPPGVPHSYYRYSPYYMDRRIHPQSGNFLPGTYATTYPDMHFVPSGFAAVGRYALPNPASARFVFPIVTVDRPALMGTATPNYGQAGGGVEVFFANGAAHLPGACFQINAG